MRFDSYHQDDGVDEAWAEEIRRRQEAIRAGTMPLHDWDETLAEIRQALAPPST